MGTAISHGHTKALGRPNDDVCAPGGGWLHHGECQQVSGHTDLHLGIVSLLCQALQSHRYHSGSAATQQPFGLSSHTNIDQAT